ncbi:hypothetical protein GN157_04065 [Flavobacterium rakeshii]|uniref:DUF4870 domain-containing protein n=1 Tax=Flavobacterium rakeshii TaxID=1038845 RepID=A0A6N8HCD0_9FLAO|nr:hypothetical protein [Flavobacterium rakeshii]MEE1898320.1 hypothetical protein [Flavobacterium rakeshii]MUV02876.1 hypothetical protein [Flavobacterium rakeshii]
MNTQPEENNGKTYAIVSYLTIIGSIIAIILNSEKKDPFASFHIRQALGLTLGFFALGYPIGFFDSWMVSSAFYLFFFILWIFGFIGALQGQMNLVPILGPFFQKLFKSI